MGQKTITHMPGRTWIIWNFLFSSLLLFRLSFSHSMRSLSSRYINPDALHVSNFCMCVLFRKSSWSGEKLLHDLLKPHCVCRQTHKLLRANTGCRKFQVAYMCSSFDTDPTYRLPFIETFPFSWNFWFWYWSFFSPLEKLLHHHHRCSFILPHHTFNK